METLKVTGATTHDDERQTHGPLLQPVAGMARAAVLAEKHVRSI
jgi:hypothetical protein